MCSAIIACHALCFLSASMYTAVHAWRRLSSLECGIDTLRAEGIGAEGYGTFPFNPQACDMSGRQGLPSRVVPEGASPRPPLPGLRPRYLQVGSSFVSAVSWLDGLSG
jgi:hypothetical protein